MAPAIPDRWIPYTPCGKVIEGTKIVCFKVPLRAIVQSKMEEIWDIKTLLSTLPTLGAVVDLTNTARYYDPKELLAAGVLHKKILMPGRIIPPEEKVNEFMEAIDEFLGKDCDFLIGVHCTHGLNRTGYMVCRYMRDRLGIPAAEAIKRFEEARGYKIERENYIADLLGKKPPPPDVGKNTVIKPLEDQFPDVADERIQSWRSEKIRGEQNNYSEESWRSRTNSWRDNDTSWRNEGTSSRNGHYLNRRGERRNNSWNERKSRTRRRISSDNLLSSSRPYDYKYDY